MNAAGGQPQGACLRLLSPAKVNLWLRVTGRRHDGYHLLDSLMVPVSLFDEITLELPEASPEKLPAVSFSCSDPTLPQGPENLAFRAASLILEETATKRPVAVRVEKTIPAGGGLGGGSSNAATVLKGLNELLALGLCRERLKELGLAIGADVPFFIDCKPAIVRGIGELIDPYELERELWLLIAVPPLRVDTGWAFGAYDEALTAGGGKHTVRELVGQGWQGETSMVNDLERVVTRAYPQVAELKAAVLKAGAEAAVMSGSGSAVVGLVAGERQGRNILKRLEGFPCKVFLTHTLSAEPDMPKPQAAGAP